MKMHPSDKDRAMNVFIAMALAAAKGAAEAGKVDMPLPTQPETPRMGWNAAISKSNRQLREYFE